MLNAMESLIASGIINEETRQTITEAWEDQLAEAKEAARSELREEFARRYQHDKSVMVEALDKMVTETLRQEIAEFKDEKQTLADERVKFNKFMRESSRKVNSFMAEKLAEELKDLRKDNRIQKNKVSRLVSESLKREIVEFRNETQGLTEDRAKIKNFMAEKLAEEIIDLRKDRKAQKGTVVQLEQFVMGQLAEEIHEFAKDKKELVETKVRLISGAKQKLAEIQKNFINKSSKLVKESVAKSLKSELGQLKEDIQVARENMFGRRLFEAFSSEFTNTHLNESKEIAKLQSLVKAKNRQLEETKKSAFKASKLAESKDRQIKIIQGNVTRKKELAELLGPLNKEKASVMSELLENVQTNKLKSVYEKYLPAVLDNSNSITKPKAKVLTENFVTVTGDKTAKPLPDVDTDYVDDIKRLAGLK